MQASKEMVYACGKIIFIDFSCFVAQIHYSGKLSHDTARVSLRRKCVQGKIEV